MAAAGLLSPDGERKGRLPYAAFLNRSRLCGAA
jgi:hypothetical protein